MLHLMTALIKSLVGEVKQFRKIVASHAQDLKTQKRSAVLRPFATVSCSFLFTVRAPCILAGKPGLNGFSTIESAFLACAKTLNDVLTDDGPVLGSVRCAGDFLSHCGLLTELYKLLNAA
jgi:hypothetical protein